MDAYGLREALESAAMTASRIAYRVGVIISPYTSEPNRADNFEQVMEDGDAYLRASRGSAIDDGYDSDYNDTRYPRRRRHSSIGSAPGLVGSTGSAYGTSYVRAAPIPIAAGTSYSAGYSANGSPLYGTSALPQPYNTTPPMGGGYIPNPVVPGQLVGGFAVPYTGSAGSYTGSSPYLGGTQYPQGMGSTIISGETTIPNVPPGSTIIIQQQPRKHRRSSTSSSHRHHHHRSRSSDPMRKYGSGAVVYHV